MSWKEFQLRTAQFLFEWCDYGKYPPEALSMQDILEGFDLLIREGIFDQRGISEQLKYFGVCLPVARINEWMKDYQRGGKEEI